MYQVEAYNNSGFLLLCTYATKTIELRIENKAVSRFAGIFTILRTQKFVIFILHNIHKYGIYAHNSYKLYRIALLYV